MLGFLRACQELGSEKYLSAEMVGVSIGDLGATLFDAGIAEPDCLGHVFFKPAGIVPGDSYADVAERDHGSVSEG